MAGPLVSVVTPTWQRHDLLFSRCILSVQAQDYPAVEHIVVSDGPDPVLAPAFKGSIMVSTPRYYELPEHDPQAQWGHYARLHGIDVAKGEYIAYLDDDNAYRPHHLQRLVAAMEGCPDAGFAYSQVAMHGRGEYVVGTDPPSCGGIDTSIIMHRRELLDTATWRWFPGIPTIDWDLTERWMAAGAAWVHVPEVTADYYFH